MSDDIQLRSERVRVLIGKIPGGLLLWTIFAIVGTVIVSYIILSTIPIQLHTDHNVLFHKEDSTFFRATLTTPSKQMMKGNKDVVLVPPIEGVERVFITDAVQSQDSVILTIRLDVSTLSHIPDSVFTHSIQIPTRPSTVMEMLLANWHGDTVR